MPREPRLPWPCLTTPWCAAWVPDQIGTLVFVRRDNEVLLIHKKTGHGAGLVNGPGGKLQPAESVVQCARRETEEEVGITPQGLECRAELRFVDTSGAQWLGFAFVASKFSGKIHETDEARPFWQPQTQIPYQQMWPDDELWLPRILTPAADFLVANFQLDGERLIAHEFECAPVVWQDRQYHFST